MIGWGMREVGIALGDGLGWGGGCGGGAGSLGWAFRLFVWIGVRKGENVSWRIGTG